MSKNNSNRFGVGTMFTVAIMVASILSSCDVDTGKKKADAAGAAKSGDAAAAAAGGSDKAGKGGGAAGGAAGKTPDKGAGAAASGLPNCGIDKDTILIAELLSTPKEKKNQTQDRGPSMDHATGQKSNAPQSPPTPSSQPAPTQKNEDNQATKSTVSPEVTFNTLVLRDAVAGGDEISKDIDSNARLNGFQKKPKEDSLNFLVDVHLDPKKNRQPALFLTTKTPSTNLNGTWDTTHVIPNDDSANPTQSIPLKQHIENLIANTNSMFKGLVIEAMTITIKNDEKTKSFKLELKNKDKSGKEQMCTAEDTKAEFKEFKKDQQPTFWTIKLATGAAGKWEDVKKDDTKAKDAPAAK